MENSTFRRITSDVSISLTFLMFGNVRLLHFYIHLYRDNAGNTQPIHSFDCSMTGCVFVMSHMVGYDTFLNT